MRQKIRPKNATATRGQGVQAVEYTAKVEQKPLLAVVTYLYILYERGATSYDRN